MLPAERHRKKYLAALPMTLITILVDHTKTPQKFPKSETRDPITPTLPGRPYPTLMDWYHRYCKSYRIADCC